MLILRREVEMICKDSKTKVHYDLKKRNGLDRIVAVPLRSGLGDEPVHAAVSVVGRPAGVAHGLALARGRIREADRWLAGCSPCSLPHLFEIWGTQDSDVGHPPIHAVRITYCGGA